MSDPHSPSIGGWITVAVMTASLTGFLGLMHGAV